MTATVEEKKVSDMTVRELKEIIREVIQESIDPDYGLELKPEVEEELRESMKQRESGEGIPVEQVKN